MKINKNRVRLFLWELLIICICFQHLVFNYIFSNLGFLKYSKEILIFAIILFDLVYEKDKILSLDKVGIFFTAFTVFLIGSSLLFSDLTKLIFSLRKYLIPIICFFGLKNFNYLKNERIQYTFWSFLFKFSALLAIWGIFQVLVLGDKFLISLGYDTVNGHLEYTFYFGNNYFIQRNCSVFASPNICAAYFSIILICSFIFEKYISRKKAIRRLYQLLYFFALMITFSRSNLLAFFVVFCVYAIHRSSNYLFLCLKALILTVIGMVFIGLVFNINFFSIIYEWIQNTLNGSESSSAGRSYIWMEAIDGIIKNPLGIGAGKVGINAINGYACENSFFAIALESGILGLVFYLLGMFSIVKTNKLNNNYNKIVKLLTIQLFVSFWFSNYVLDLEIMCLYMVISGLGTISIRRNANLKYECKNQITLNKNILNI